MSCRTPASDSNRRGVSSTARQIVLAAVLLWSLLGAGLPLSHGTSTTLPPEQCDACQSDPEVVLCEAHLARETEVLKAQRRELERLSEERRITAMEAIAALTQAHSNAPSPTVARVLGSMLVVESTLVRTRAAELLADGQHQRTTLEMMTAAVDPLVRDLQKQTERYLELEAVVTKEGTKKKGKEATLDDLQEKLDALDEAMALDEKLGAMNETRGAFARCLATIPDDRSIAALEKLLLPDELRLNREVVVESLLLFGTVSSVELVIGSLKPFVKMLRETEARVKKERRARLPKKPGWYQGSKEHWVARKQKEKDARVDTFQARLDEVTAVVETLHDMLAKFAENNALSAPPKWDSKRFHSAWVAWYRKNITDLNAPPGNIR